MVRRPSSKKGRRKRLDAFLVAGIALAAVIIIFYLFLRPHDKAGKPHKPSPPVQSMRPSQKKPTRESEVEQPVKARVAIVIDDLGRDSKTADELIALNKDITLAILPGLPHSAAVATMAIKNGNEVLVHLPMERKNNKERPGARGTLHLDMTPAQFLETLRKDMESIPGAVGISNHEGSALTENKEAMKFLMAELKAQDMMFLDSLTSPKSIAYVTAREFGVRAAKRDVFLDNDASDPDQICAQLKRLEQIAAKRGWAIAIGHPHPETIRALRGWLKEAGASGIKIVHVSKLVR